MDRDSVNSSTRMGALCLDLEKIGKGEKPGGLEKKIYAELEREFENVRKAFTEGIG